MTALLDSGLVISNSILRVKSVKYVSLHTRMRVFDWHNITLLEAV